MVPYGKMSPFYTESDTMMASDLPITSPVIFIEECRFCQLKSTDALIPSARRIEILQHLLGIGIGFVTVQSVVFYAKRLQEDAI